MIRINLLGRKVQKWRATMWFAVRTWVPRIAVLAVCVLLAWWSVPRLSDFIVLGSEPPRTAERRAPAPSVPTRAAEVRDPRFGTLRVLTNDPDAIVRVDGKVQSGDLEVVVSGLVPAPQRHPVQVTSRGEDRWKWVEIQAGQEVVLRVNFDEQSLPPASASAPIPTRTAPVEARAVPSGPQPFTPAVAKLKPGEIIWVTGNHYRVPKCLIFAIWEKETSLLASGWRGDRVDWFYGARVIESDGKCIERYGVEKCTKHWRAIVSLCKQERGGVPICNPDDVHTSYALAVGPMQHMPGQLAEPCSTGSNEYCRTRDAVDFDRDGVVDPWSLPDAFAMTAVELRRYYERCGSWRCAANRYYGSARGGYYDGAWKQRGENEIWRDGVKQLWQKCCQEFGCSEPTSRD